MTSATSTILPDSTMCLLMFVVYYNELLLKSSRVWSATKSLWVAQLPKILGDSWWNLEFMGSALIHWLPGLCCTFAGYFIYYFSLSELCVSQGWDTSHTTKNGSQESGSPKASMGKCDSPQSRDVFWWWFTSPSSRPLEFSGTTVV